MRRVLAVVIVMVCAGGTARGALTAPSTVPVTREREAAEPSRETLRFDMPAQPLSDALTEFHRLTGASLLYDADAASGRFGNALHGNLPPAAALHRLLEGTGIVAHPTSETGFLLTPAPADAARARLSSLPPPFMPAPDAAPLEDPFDGYRGRFQARILSALCADPKAVPGTYRLAMNAWIGSDSRIARVLIHPTGLTSRDARIEAVLTGLDMRNTVPPRLSQPIALLVLPRPPSQTGDCPSPGARLP